MDDEEIPAKRARRGEEPADDGIALNHPTQATLMGIPVELRLMIYWHLLVPFSKTVLDPGNLVDHHRFLCYGKYRHGVQGFLFPLGCPCTTRDVHLKILRCCKQVFKEALPVLYEDRTINVELPYINVPAVIPIAQTFRLLPDAARPFIRTARIESSRCHRFIRASKRFPFRRKAGLPFKFLSDYLAEYPRLETLQLAVRFEGQCVSASVRFHQTIRLEDLTDALAPIARLESLKTLRLDTLQIGGSTQGPDMFVQALQQLADSLGLSFSHGHEHRADSP